MACWRTSVNGDSIKPSCLSSDSTSHFVQSRAYGTAPTILLLLWLPGCCLSPSRSMLGPTVARFELHSDPRKHWKHATRYSSARWASPDDYVVLENLGRTLVWTWKKSSLSLVQAFLWPNLDLIPLSTNDRSWRSLRFTGRPWREAPLMVPGSVLVLLTWTKFKTGTTASTQLTKMQGSF